MTTEDETVFSLMAQVLENDALNLEQKLKLLDEIRKSRPALEDRSIYRWVVYFLGAALIFSMVAVIICVLMKETNIPDGLVALGSGALGALSGFLPNRPKSETTTSPRPSK